MPISKVTQTLLHCQRSFDPFLTSPRTRLKFPFEVPQSLILALESSLGKNGPAVSGGGYFKMKTTKGLRIALFGALLLFAGNVLVRAQATQQTGDQSQADSNTVKKDKDAKAGAA